MSYKQRLKKAKKERSNGGHGIIRVIFVCSFFSYLE